MQTSNCIIPALIFTEDFSLGDPMGAVLHTQTYSLYTSMTKKGIDLLSEMVFR
jgi:hypothetical protein